MQFLLHKWKVDQSYKLTSDEIPPHYGLLCIPSSFLEQEEVEIYAYLVQLDYYVPMLFMHWNNLSQATWSINQEFHLEIQLFQSKKFTAFITFFNNKDQSWSLSIT